MCLMMKSLFPFEAMVKSPSWSTIVFALSSAIRSLDGVDGFRSSYHRVASGKMDSKYREVSFLENGFLGSSVVWQ